MKNHEWRWVYLSFVSVVVSLVLIGYANQFMDPMSGRYAVMFVSFFIALTLVAVALLFWSRARTVDMLLDGRNIIAHWTYSPEASSVSADREFMEYQEANRALFIVVGGFFVVAILVLLALGGEAGGLTALVLVGMLGVIALVAWGAPRIVYRRALKAIPEAYIGRNGIIYREIVYPFRSFLNHLDGVSFREAERGNPPLLTFSFIQVVGLSILRPYAVSVPVPPLVKRSGLERSPGCCTRDRRRGAAVLIGPLSPLLGERDSLTTFSGQGLSVSRLKKREGIFELDPADPIVAGITAPRGSS